MSTIDAARASAFAEWTAAAGVRVRLERIPEFHLRPATRVYLGDRTPLRVAPRVPPAIFRPSAR